ncbi:unnamed protein product [Prunus brigantina]
MLLFLFLLFSFAATITRLTGSVNLYSSEIDRNPFFLGPKITSFSSSSSANNVGGAALLLPLQDDDPLSCTRSSIAFTSNSEKKLIEFGIINDFSMLLLRQLALAPAAAVAIFNNQYQILIFVL